MPSAGKVAVAWRLVQFSSDFKAFVDETNPSLDELFRYQIYRSTSIFAEDWSLVQSVSANTASCQETLPDSKVYYYKIRAIDASLNYADSDIISSEGQIFVVGADHSYLGFAQGLTALMRKENNEYQNDIIFDVSEKQDEEIGSIIKSIELKAYKIIRSSSIFSLENIERYNCSKDINGEHVIPQLSVSMLVNSGQVLAKAPALRTLSSVEINDSLAGYYFNGTEWLRVNGITDQVAETVKVGARFTGKYQLRIAAKATEFTFYGIMPKIVTPNNDGQNDRVLFRFANPRSSMILIKIFDINGGLTRKLDESSRTSDIHGDYIYWDAKDDNNMTVLPGVYIYQLEGEGKLFNGTIVVAR
jgi:hypothetical protein